MDLMAELYLFQLMSPPPELEEYRGLETRTSESNPEGPNCIIIHNDSAGSCARFRAYDLGIDQMCL